MSITSYPSIPHRRNLTLSSASLWGDDVHQSFLALPPDIYPGCGSGFPVAGPYWAGEEKFDRRVEAMFRCHVSWVDGGETAGGQVQTVMDLLAPTTRTD